MPQVRPQSFVPFFTTIKKRDQRLVPFEASKITHALLKAGQASGEFGQPEARRLTMQVLAIAQSLIEAEIPDVEEIQDVVEEVLLSSAFKKTAKAYILYRDQHARLREMVTQTDLDLIDGYLQQLDWQVQENSNMSYSLQGLNNYISSELSRTYWLNKIYPAEVRDAHLRGDLHIHDLNLLSVYCVGWDLRDLLLCGFTGAPARPRAHRPTIFAAHSDRSSTSSIPSRAKRPEPKPSPVSTPCSPPLSAMTASVFARSNRPCRSLSSTSTSPPGSVFRPPSPT